MESGDDVLLVQWLDQFRQCVCVCVCVYLLDAGDGHVALHPSVLPLFGELIINLPGAEDDSLHLLRTLQRCCASFWDQPLEVSSYRREKKKSESLLD